MMSRSFIVILPVLPDYRFAFFPQSEIEHKHDE